MYFTILKVGIQIDNFQIVTFYSFTHHLVELATLLVSETSEQ